MSDEFRYRLSGGDGLLYIGISNDWARRLREYWLSKPWANEIMNVALEAFTAPNVQADLVEIRNRVAHGYVPTHGEANRVIGAASAIIDGLDLFPAHCDEIGREDRKTWKDA